MHILSERGFFKTFLTCYTQYLTNIFCYYLLLIFPLVFSTSGYADITEIKYYFFLIPTLIYLGLLLLISLELLVIGQIHLPQPKNIWQQSTMAQRLVVLFLFICIISALASPYQDIVWQGSGRYEGLLTTMLYGAVFLLVSTFGSFRQGYILALATSVGINSAIALLQFCGFNPFTLYPEGYTYQDAGVYYSGQFLGTIGNADLFAAFLCLTVPLSIIWAIKQKKPSWRWLSLASGLLGLLVLLLSQVAAGILAIIGTALVLFPLAATNARQRRIRLLIVIGVIIVLLLIIFCFGNYLGGTIAEFHALLHGQIDATFGSGRIAIWQNVLKLIPERLLLGGGPDTLMARLNMSFERQDVVTDTMLIAQVDNAHNEYLNLLANCGLLALLAYLAALISTAWRCRRTIHSDAVTFSLAAALLCYCLQAFFSFSLVIVSPLFWLIWGLLDNCLKTNAKLDNNPK